MRFNQDAYVGTYASSTLFAVAQSRTRVSVVVDRCGLKLSNTIAIRTCGGCRLRQVAGEGEELGAALAGLDVPVEPVGGQVVAGEQLPHPVRAGVGGAPSPAPRRARGPAAGGGRRPLPARAGLQVERPELVHADHGGRSPGPGGAWPSAIAYSSRMRFFFVS